MADFFSSGWSIYIIALTLVSILACFWLALSLSSGKVQVDENGQTVSTGHVWDEDLVELNNPLPRWWLYLFYITCVFGLIYLALYPGLGSYQGMLNWSQTGQYDDEVTAVAQRVQPLFNKYQSQDIKTVAADPEAVQMGQRMYLTYCVQCHGSDARGSGGYPNLTDKDWLGDGGPDYIKTTILQGRHGVMPAMGAAVGGADAIDKLASYVVSLSGGGHDAVKAALGRDLFGTCAACHGPDGKGNAALGAPNLTDNIWLHGGGGKSQIVRAIMQGYQSQMPAFAHLIDESRAHVLAAYVWSLSNKPGVANE